LTPSGVELGEVFGLLAALAWGTTGLLVRAHGAGMHAIVINALRCGISGVFFVSLWPFVSTHQPVPTLAWFLLGFSLLAGLGIGDSLYFEALKRIGVARAMPISMGYPVLSSIGAVVVLHESIGPLAAIGVVLTLAGVYLVALRSSGKGPPEGRPNNYWLGVGMAATAAVSWSCSTLALGPALTMVDVPTAGAVRTPVASALLFLAARRAGVLPKATEFQRHTLAAIALMGLVSVAATALFLISVTLAGPGRAAVLSATSPLFGVPLSILLLGERGSWRIGAGTVVSVIGVILLTQV
jgi:drug/metabolite transporter (DMT)-like permease